MKVSIFTALSGAGIVSGAPGPASAQTDAGQTDAGPERTRRKSTSLGRIERRQARGLEGRVLFLIMLGSILAAEPALAQFSGGAAGAAARQGRMEDALSRSALERATGPHDPPAARDTQNPRRVRRAHQAAEMINNGDCAGALALATNARDTHLATRVNEVCGQVAVSPPVAADTPRP